MDTKSDIDFLELLSRYMQMANIATSTEDDTDDYDYSDIPYISDIETDEENQEPDEDYETWKLKNFGR